MIKIIEKYWPLISILFIFAIIGSLFYWPGVSHSLATIVMVLGAGMVILFAVQGHVREYRQGRIDRRRLALHIVVDISGILITMAVVIVAARAVGEYVGLAVGKAAESAKPGLGIPAAIVSGLAAALIVGLMVGYVVRLLWGKLTKVKQPTPAPENS
jgi:O-antigen/teichoic acid export membrane protein